MAIVSLAFVCCVSLCKEVLTITVCERFALLPNDKKQMIAGELDRSVREIERKISVGLPFLLLSHSSQVLMKL